MCIVDEYTFHRELDRGWKNLAETMYAVCAEKGGGVIFSRNWYGRIEDIILKSMDTVADTRDSIICSKMKKKGIKKFLKNLISCFDDIHSVLDSVKNEKEMGIRFTKDGYMRIKNYIRAAIDNISFVINTLEIILASKEHSGIKFEMGRKQV